MQVERRLIGASRVLGWVVSVAVVTACGGGGPRGNAHVDYDGSTLVVEGTEYPREKSFDPEGSYRPGLVVVQLPHGQVEKALVLIDRYGLSLEGRSTQGGLLIKTPERFEDQWGAALSSQLGAGSVATRELAQGASAPPPAPVSNNDSDAVAGEPVPDHEPSADDVRRLVIARYEQIEDAGGFPMTVTATGQAVVIHSKVFSVQKESCRKEVRAKPGEWTCEAALMMAMCSGDCDPSREEPSSKGERIPVVWDAAKGEFALWQ